MPAPKAMSKNARFIKSVIPAYKSNRRATFGAVMRHKNLRNYKLLNPTPRVLLREASASH